MNKTFLHLEIILLLAVPTAAVAQDSISEKSITGNVMTEVNFGHRHGQEKPTVIDFPHIVAGATWQMGHGWSAVAEVEYERFYSDGSWGNNFRDNYATNKLYVNKAWSDALNVKMGIVDIPVGTTNSGGPALTIYDPSSESALLPMTWHDGGVAVWGQTGMFHYEVGAYVYGAAPLKDSRMVGTAARVGMTTGGFDVSLSGYYGTTKVGMEHRQGLDIDGQEHIGHVALDFAYLANGWTIDGQAIASSGNGNRAVGVEAGYDVATLMRLENFSLIPFARYDGVYHVADVSCNKYTIGLNTTLPLGFTFKAEASRQNPTDTRHSTSFDISIGWQGEF